MICLYAANWDPICCPADVAPLQEITTVLSATLALALRHAGRVAPSYPSDLAEQRPLQAIAPAEETGDPPYFAYGDLLAAPCYGQTPRAAMAGAARMLCCQIARVGGASNDATTLLVFHYALEMLRRYECDTVAVPRANQEAERWLARLGAAQRAS